MIWSNIIVTLSNFSFIGYLHYFKVTNAHILTYIPMIASILYHAAERKHGLPGIYPLNQYCNELIWFDRIAAAGVSVYAANRYITHGDITEFISYGIIGLMCLGISEYDIIAKLFGIKLKMNIYVFTVFHSIWHNIAFWLLAKALSI